MHSDGKNVVKTREGVKQQQQRSFDRVALMSFL